MTQGIITMTMASTEAFQADEHPIFSTGNEQTSGGLGPQPFSFTGRGSEYFRIWIINLLLSFITLGIYSAWAKVRRNRYFYDSTQVAGSSFAYYGNPIAILKGRFIAIACIIGLNLLAHASQLLGIIAGLVLIVTMPWLVWKSLQFKLYNSGYRGIRFGFRGNLMQAYMHFLLLPVLAFVSLFTLAPFAHHHIKKFQHSESRFGSSYFSFNARVSSFYGIYLIFISAFVVCIMVLVDLFAVGAITFLEQFFHKNGSNVFTIIGCIIMGFYTVMACLYCLTPLFLTMLYNLIWSHTKIGEHRFVCKISLLKTIYIMLTNGIGIVFTFGLFIPFATIRSMKYRIESMTLIPADNLDNIIADEQQKTSATGEGMLDLFGYDISL